MVLSSCQIVPPLTATNEVFPSSIFVTGSLRVCVGFARALVNVKCLLQWSIKEELAALYFSGRFTPDLAKTKLMRSRLRATPLRSSLCRATATLRS
jgi:hypothetical protein